MNILPPSITQIPAKVAQRLDDSKKVVPYWRKFFRIRSIQWSLWGILVAFSQTALLLGGVYQLHDWLGKATFGLVMALSFLGSMYGSLTKQDSLNKPDTDDANDQHA